MSHLLEIENLNVSIATVDGPVELLSEVGFQLQQGETLGLVGESGCGKSMTALTIMGLLPDTARVSGRIRFHQRDLLTLSEAEYCQIRGGDIAMVFQEPMTALNPVQTIGKQIAEGIRMHLRLSRADTAARVQQLLDRVGLAAPRFSPQLYPHQLSGGQRQRVVLAIALASKPKLLIADEPTTALDVVVQAQILELIMEVVDQDGMGLLLITHDLGVVAETTDRVNVMYAGRIVESCPTGSLFQHMAHPYTQGLFRAMPQTVVMASGRGDNRKPRLNTIPGTVPAPGAQLRGCRFNNRCNQAQQRCGRQTPQPLEISAGHQASCFFPNVHD